MNAQAWFATMASGLVASDRTIEQGVMLHAPALKRSGRFFAFATGEDVVVKLSAARVQELIASGTGRPCVIRRGAPMREWVRLKPDGDQVWAHVIEARDFVGQQQRR